MRPYRMRCPARKPRIAVLDDYMGVAHRLANWSRVQQQAELTFIREPLENTSTQLANYDVICLLRERTPMPEQVLRSLPQLKAIVATGRQNRTLCHVTADELGIAIMTTTGSGDGVYATVELAWGLIIALMRHIPHQTAAMREGAWQTLLGDALHGKTLGLIGLGKLGSRMALVGRAFGMRPLAWSPNLTADRAATGGAEFAKRDALLRHSDVVSLHLVLGPTTRGIIDADALAIMKPDALLINTARGALISETALIEALKTRRLRAAGIDVYDQEPLAPDHPLRALPNALLTPHLGYSVKQTFEAFYRETVENLEAWLDGAPIRLHTFRKDEDHATITT